MAKKPSGVHVAGAMMSEPIYEIINRTAEQACGNGHMQLSILTWALITSARHGGLSESELHDLISQAWKIDLDAFEKQARAMPMGHG